MARYFSDQANACTDGISTATTFAPSISNTTACGIGQQMNITVNGNLGTKPWDLVSSSTGGSKTMFLQAAVSGSHTWSAGGIENFPADPVGLGTVNWTHGQTNDSVVIQGFDNKYGVAIPGGSGALVQPGDTITITLSSWLTGQSTTSRVMVPQPSKVKHFVVTPDVHSSLPIYVGDAPSVNGELVDAGGCPAQGLELKPQSDAVSDVFYPIKTTTLGDGSFSFKYTAGSPAGTHHVSITSPVSATLPIAVHPIADSLSSVIGGVAGGQPITLTGQGFDSGGTKISFSRSNATSFATNVTVPNGHTVKLTTPPSPLSGQRPGIVDVIATVNGQDSVALSYRYVVPSQPVLTFISNTCPFAGDESVNSLQVDAYNADGTNATETIALSTPYPAFENGTGQFATTLSVNPGATVQMKGIGPVTATPSADPTLAVTRKYKEGPLEKGCNPAASQKYTVIDYQPGPGPVENTFINAVVSLDGKSVAWVNASAATPASVPADREPASKVIEGDYVLLMDNTEIATTAKLVQVNALGRHELRSLMREHQFAIGAVEKDFKKVRFLGPNFSIAVAAKLAASDVVFSTPAVMSFPIGDRRDSAQYRILYLAPAATTWTESKTLLVRSDGRQFVRASVTDAGIYALVRMEP